MQRLALSFAFLILILSACLSHASELRGLWVDAWNPGFKSPAEAAEMVARASECNFNTLFVQVRRRGDVYYSSGIEPRAGDAASGYDPLADVVSKAHAVGIEVHAWICVYEVYHDVPQNTPNPAQVHVCHPEWLMKDYRGATKFPGDKIFLDPGVPEVKSYLTSIVQEIVQNYNVDGIHLDIARYPGREGGYNETSVALFNQETGRSGQPDKDDQAWCLWRSAEVRQFVQAAYQAAIAIRPSVRVSAAVFSNVEDARTQRFQDWPEWLSAGVLDFAVAMVFPMDSTVFARTTETCLSQASSRPVYIGQGAYRISATKTLEQVAAAREKGAAGIVVYNYHYCRTPHAGDTASPLDALKAGPFSQPDTVPVLGWK